MVRPVNSRSRDSLLLLISYEVSSLIRNSAGWNIMMVDRHSVSSDSSVSRSIVCKEGKFISRGSIPRRTKCCLFLDGSCPM